MGLINYCKIFTRKSYTKI